MRYIGAVRFPIRVSWKFIRDYPESARVTRILLRSFSVTYKVWRKISPQMGADLDHNGRLVWDTAGTDWARLLEECGQLKIAVIGKDKVQRDCRYVVVANHTSTLDIIAVPKGVPNAMFVVKSNIVKSRYPIISAAVKKGGQIIIERGDTAQATRAINEGMRSRPRTSPVFFVEGTRSPDGHIGPFKKGAFRAAIDNGIPILPVVISGSHRALPKGTLMGFRRGSTIYVECLDPIDTKGMTLEDLPALMERTRERMVDVYYGYSCNPRPRDGQTHAIPPRPDLPSHDQYELRPLV